MAIPQPFNPAQHPPGRIVPAPKSGAPRRGQGQRGAAAPSASGERVPRLRRRASPVPGVRIYGLTASLNVTLKLTRASEAVYYVERADDAWYIDGMMTVHEFVKRTLQGDFMVHDRPSRRRRR